MLKIMRNCPMFNYGKLEIHFLHKYLTEFVKIISNNYDYISTEINKFHPPMLFRLIAMIKTNVLTYDEK